MLHRHHRFEAQVFVFEGDRRQFRLSVFLLLAVTFPDAMRKEYPSPILTVIAAIYWLIVLLLIQFYLRFRGLRFGVITLQLRRGKIVRRDYCCCCCLHRVCLSFPLCIYLLCISRMWRSARRGLPAYGE